MFHRCVRPRRRSGVPLHRLRVPYRTWKAVPPRGGNAGDSPRQGGSLLLVKVSPLACRKRKTAGCTMHPAVYSTRNRELPAVSTAAIAPAAVTVARALLTRLGLVDRQVPAAHHGAVEGIDGGIRLRISGHFHKAEAFGLAGVLVRDDRRRGDRAGRGEQVLQVLLGSRVGQSAHINTLCHSGWLLSSLSLQESGRVSSAG